MKKILFLYNNYEREHTIIELICCKLENKKVVTFREGITDKDLIKKIFRIRPNIVFTFPITTQIQIDVYRILKIFFHSVIITYTTEGLLDYHNKECVKLWSGFYNYPCTLVDYHIYWGRLAAKYIGYELYKQRKLIGKYQIKVLGNPMYEKVYKEDKRLEKIYKDSRNKILILTGFHTSLYTKQDFIYAQDVVNIMGKSKKEILYDESLTKFCEASSSEKEYCEKYIQHIIEAAAANPDILFIVKLHPQEILINKEYPNKIEYLKRLENIENIYVLNKSIPIGTLLPYCKLMVHYGSTTALEAYIYKVPTLKLELTKVKNEFMAETQRLTESTFYADIDEENAISKYVTELKTRGNLFNESIIIQRQLYDYMDYVDEKNYKPSEKIANFLCGHLKYHKMCISIGELYGMMHFIRKTLKN